MKLKSIRIQNVLGARAVDITLGCPVALIAGKNYSGKSSVQEAVRMALTGETVRVALKKDYGSLVTEGQEAGFAVVELDDGQAAMTLPNGAHEITSGTVMQHARSLPYVLDAQRFARMSQQDRRAFLFGLMGLSADGPAVRARLEAKGCDAKKIEAIMPILRAGFAAACEDAKGKATAAKGAWRAVTGETYGAKKAVGWTANKPSYDKAALNTAKAQSAANDEAIEKASAAVGELSGQEKRYAEQKGRLSELRERAGHYARIQDKLNRDEAELKRWKEKVGETRKKAGAVPYEPPLACPHCAGLVLYRTNINGGELQAYEQPNTADPEAIESLPEYEKAMALMESSVANGKRDLAAADAAANALREIEDAGLTDPPDADAIKAAKNLVDDLKQKRANLLGQIKALEDAERAAAVADKKTADAARHHADVAAWDLVGGALAPDGIPGEMLAEALGPINARLAQSAADTGWRAIRINDAMEIIAAHDLPGVHADRSYSLLSESEKWRVDAMIAEALSNLAGLKLLVLDRFDVLDIQGRADLIAWLDILAANAEIDTCLLFGTLKQIPTGLPCTASAFWIENGNLHAPLPIATTEN